MSDRPNPLDEGSIKEIWRYFFGPLVYYKPDNVLLRDWYAHLFHLDTRYIDQYVATAEFKMPGLFWQAPHVKTQGLGYRTIKEGTGLMVRHDTIDDVYDIEFFGGKSERTQVFTLDKHEFNSIRPKIAEMKGHFKRKYRGKDARKK